MQMLPTVELHWAMMETTLQSALNVAVLMLMFCATALQEYNVFWVVHMFLKELLINFQDRIRLK